MEVNDTGRVEVAENVSLYSDNEIETLAEIDQTDIEFALIDTDDDFLFALLNADTIR